MAGDDSAGRGIHRPTEAVSDPLYGILRQQLAAGFENLFPNRRRSVSPINIPPFQRDQRRSITRPDAEL